MSDKKTVLQYLMFAHPGHKKPYWEFSKQWDEKYGTQILKMMGHNVLFPPDGQDGSGDFSRPQIRECLQNIDAQAYPYVMINMEREAYALQNGYIIPETISKKVNCIDFCKQTRPDLKFAYYKEPPADQRLLSGGNLFDNAKWKGKCEELQPVAKRQAWYCPCVYPDRNWGGITVATDYLKRQIEVCRAYGDQPIYPIICMEYLDLWRGWRASMKQQKLWETGEYLHTPDPDERKNLEARLMSGRCWRQLMRTALQEGDGCVIWGGQGSPCWWDEAPWWQETIELLYDFNVVPGIINN